MSENDVSYDDVPCDLMRLIFTKQRPEDLVVSMCVCKSWRAIIRDSSFVYMHLKHCRRTALTDHNASLIVDGAHNYDAFQFSMRFSEEFSGHQHCRIIFDNLYYSVETSCDGLVLLSATGCRQKMLLWNPAIRKFKLIPVSGIRNLLHCRTGFRPVHEQQVLVVGFGCIECTNKYDYKIVQVLYYFSDDAFQHSYVTVYSLWSNSWRRIRATPPCYTNVNVSNAFVNEAVHWRAESSADCWVIMAFDLREEVFREIPLPDHHHDYYSMYWYIAVFEELLSVVLHYQNQEGYDFVEIWVMKEYRVVDSWSKLFVVGPTRFLYPLGYMKNRRVLLESRFEKLVIYHPNYGHRQDVMHPAGLATYLESLALLDD
ncbi:hypothetical protein PVL29_015507 [Vitis rotundifolia]|uniref:F-box domain-containing protein n=1 Tax=Vitis rotundifolia TaxID=103349 RepID=A0AA39DJ06_VITRO|nr:hypothetical protein PVL29_015507 [Vitis rotundifolia]